jgi:hypothetical protein
VGGGEVVDDQGWVTVAESTGRGGHRQKLLGQRISENLTARPPSGESRSTPWAATSINQQCGRA